MKSDLPRLFYKTGIILFIISGILFACDTSDDEDYKATATFTVSGFIIDDVTGDSLSNVKVSLGVPLPTEGQQQIIYTASTVTDDKGGFRLSVTDYPQQQKYTLKIEPATEDISFPILTKPVEFINPSFINSNGVWYAGEAIKDLDTIEVGPVEYKEEEEEETQP